MMIFKTLSIGRRMGLWLLALGVLSLAGASAYVHALRGDLEDQALERRAHELSELLTQRLATKFDVGLTNAVTVARDPVLHMALESGDPEIARALVESVRKAYGRHTNYQGIQIHLFDREGRAFFDSAKRPEAAAGTPARTGVERALSERKTQAVFDRDASGNVLIRAFAPILRDDTLLGAVELTQGTGSISRDFENEGTMYLMLLDRRHLNETQPAWKNTAIGELVLANNKWYSEPVVAFARALDLPALQQGGRLLDERWFSVGVPVKGADGTVLALHLLGLPADVLTSDMRAATRLADTLLIALALLTVLLVGVTMLLVRQLVARPLGQIAQAMHSIAEGEGDLTRRIDVRRRDEIGEVALYFNTFADKIQTLVRQIATQGEDVSRAADALEQTTLHTREGAQVQQTEVIQVAAAITEMSAAVAEVARHAQHTLQSTEESEKEVRIAEDSMTHLVEAIERQTTQIQETASGMGALAQESESIGEVVRVIRDIADLTNLLALNAAIESARAGEHGRGFAVVANEVRQLAARTHESTQSIEETVQRLQTRIRDAVQRMDHNLDQAQRSLNHVQETQSHLSEIAQMMRRIAEMNTQIATATEEESATTHELSRSINHIREVAEQSTLRAGETARSSEALLDVARAMRAQVERFRF